MDLEVDRRPYLSGYHRGEALQKMIRSASQTGKEIAEGIHYSRPALFKFFKKEDLGWKTIDKVVDYLSGTETEFDPLPFFPDFNVNQLWAQAEGLKQQVEGLNAEITELKSKYMSVLEENRGLRAELDGK